MTTDRPAILRPNRDHMLGHLTALFGDAMKGQIEIAWTEGDNRGISQAQLFDVGDLDAIVERAYDINSRAGNNIYVGMATRKESVAPFGRGKDEDYLATHAVAVDLDEPGALEAAKAKYEALNLRPSFAVVTGVKPHQRAQLWWKLDAPFLNPKVHTEIQKGLAHVFGGDRSIINPGRVMRLGGTIAWPKKAGRETELTAFYPVSQIEYPTARMSAVAAEGLKDQPEPSQPKHSLGLDTGHVGADIDALIREAAVEGRWHESVLRLIASLVGKGLPDSAIYAMAPSLTMAGYTVAQTQDDMRVMIDGARAKGYTPQIAVQPTEQQIAAAEKIDDAWARPVGILNPAARPPRDWLIDREVLRGHVCLIVAAPGVGKTTFAMQRAVSVASGVDFMSKGIDRPRKVLFINNEETRDELERKVEAIQQRFDVPSQPLAENLWLASGVDDEKLVVAAYAADGRTVIKTESQAKVKALIERERFDLVIIDPLVQAHAVNENSNSDIQPVLAFLRDMALPANAGLYVVHHTRKLGNNERSAAGDMDAARGGSSMTGEAHMVFTLTTMAKDEAEFYGVPDDDRNHYLAFTEAKEKFGPRTSAEWLARHGEQMRRKGLIAYEEIGVLLPHEFKDVTISEGSVIAFLHEVDRAWKAGEPYKEHPQSRSKWLVRAVQQSLRLSKTKARELISDWTENGLIETAAYTTPQRKRDEGYRVLAYPGRA